MSRKSEGPRVNAGRTFADKDRPTRWYVVLPVDAVWSLVWWEDGRVRTIPMSHMTREKIRITVFDFPMSQRHMQLSDVITFHGYDKPKEFEQKIVTCKEYQRPIICTEWLTRQRGNTFESILPLFAQHHVGGYHWGLVAGKTQTSLPWGFKPGDPLPKVWQYDVFRGDGKPYDAGEFELLRQYAEQFRLNRRWSKEKAQQWYQQAAPIRGCNYLPRSATNTTEMWQRETFDPKTIDQELGWAKSVGFNSLRVFV
ncbi:hypothetical protein LCGC14_2085820, partial [marine sediment metagenome]